MSNFQKKVLGNIWAIDCSPDQRESLKTILTALDISTGPLARHTFQTAGPVRASTFYLSLARTGHLDICRATRFQIVLARTMTIHSMYFSRPHLGSFRAALLLQRDASVSRVRVGHVNQTRQCLDHAALQREHPGRIRALSSAKHMSWFRVREWLWIRNRTRWSLGY